MALWVAIVHCQCPLSMSMIISIFVTIKDKRIPLNLGCFMNFREFAAFKILFVGKIDTYCFLGDHISLRFYYKHEVS